MDQVVTRADIDDNKLTFTPVTGATGDNYASFMFKVNDGTDFSADANTITFNLGVVQGSTEIWSATLTADKQGYCDAVAPPCPDSPYGALSDNDFILDGITYTVESIRWGSNETKNVHLTLDRDFPAASLPNLTLHVGSHSFALSAATRGISDNDGLGHVLDNNYRWTPRPAEFDELEGTTVTVKLVSGSSTATTSTDATLSALALENASDDSAIAISPVFASGTTSYTASVVNGVDEVTINPTVNESNATVEYLDSTDTAITDADGTKTGQQVSLAEGANTIKVKVTAQDTTTTETYTVVVTRAVGATNRVPTVVNAIADRTATAGTALNFAFPAATFNDADTGDTLTYTATKPDDSALPSWLSFAPATRAFSGTPQAADVGTVTVKVTASDGNGGSVNDTFDIVVSAAPNTPPTAADNTVTTAEDTVYNFSATDFGFVDPDGDPLASVKIVTPPASGKGTLALSGTAVAADEVVPAASIGNLAYTPPQTRTATGYASFTFKVSDGTDVSAAANTMTIDVTPGNDPATGEPTISGTARVGRTLTVSTAGIMDVEGLAEHV